jgi:hypothetical protein
MSDGIDAAMNPMQPPTVDSVTHVIAAEARRGKLSDRHNAVLLRRDPRRRGIHSGALDGFCAHIA